jgi:hypothetical protein
VAEAAAQVRSKLGKLGYVKSLRFCACTRHAVIMPSATTAGGHGRYGGGAAAARLPPTDVTAELQETLARLHSLQRKVQALEGHLRDQQPEPQALQALHAAVAMPPPVPASALPPFQSLEAPAQGSPWLEVGPNQLVVPHGGGEAVVWVRQATAEAAADAVAKCVDGLDGGQLPLLPASEEHQLIAFGGNRKALSDGTCRR